MNIIICGVGRVGLTIASYLSMHDNNIVIIDADAQLVKRVSDTYDITGIVGHGSQPDILKKAGAEDADIIIAVTDCDEVNMVACQVAHSVFNMPKKIARIRNKEYRDTAWSNLFSRNHMPIDVIVSPEDEIAEAIINRMSVPGTTNDISLLDDRLHISGIIIDKMNKICGERIQDIYLSNRTHEFRIFMIVRDAKTLIPNDDTIIEDGDEIYFICDKSKLLTILAELLEKQTYYDGNIVICGGGVIGQSVCHLIEQHPHFSKNNLIIIEQDMKQAREINREFEKALVLNGSALDYEILKEANIKKTSLFVTVMNSNENNILSAVLAKKMGAQYSIALSNNKLYNQLLPERFVDAIVSPEVVTITGILQSLRQGAIKAVHSIRDTKMEIIEAKISDECGIANIPLEELNLDNNIKIIAIYCEKEHKTVLPYSKTIINSGDIVILSAYNVKQEDIQALFSFSVSLF